MKEGEEGKKRRERKKREEGKLLEELISELGWLDEEEERERIKILTKKHMWRDIHRAIVSTIMLGNTRQHMYQR